MDEKGGEQKQVAKNWGGIYPAMGGRPIISCASNS